jgi:NitT/TauT family transport system permease protein
MAAPDKNFFSIRLAKLGIDPLNDVQWRVFPADLDQRRHRRRCLARRRRDYPLPARHRRLRTHRAARERHGHTRLGLALLTFGCRLLGIRPPERISRTGPWLILLAASFAAWELVTAKFAVLPRPFFASPQALLEVFTDDYPKLGDSVWHSLALLAGGYAIGAACGFIAGVAIGWSRTVGYWAHPVLRLVEPLAATAWLPLAFFAFPSSHSASTFLIALATGFPVTVLT